MRERERLASAKCRASIKRPLFLQSNDIWNFVLNDWI